VVAAVLILAVLVWGICLYSLARQIGKPFPGFFYSPDRIVSGFTPRDFSGWRSGLRPLDRIVEVNGRHWRQMQREVREAGIGTELVYTIERGGLRLHIAVPTMEFTTGILMRFLPGYLASALVFLAVGIFLFIKNPGVRLNRYLFVYLLIWAVGTGIFWNAFLDQYKWAVYLMYLYAVGAPVAGWIFFWSFPADRTRKEFLQRWPLIRTFTILCIAVAIYICGLFLLASILDLPILWRLHLGSIRWFYFTVFALGSLALKILPLLLIILRPGTERTIRRQSVVLLLGLCAGLTGWYLFFWVAGTIHVPPVANPQWGAALATLYPLSVGYAVLRYQLFDIRLAIRKGLVYSLLTAVLTAVFLLFSLLIGYLLQGLSGQRSLLVAFLSALAVAILFLPARNRIQTLVDRLFFHRDVETRAALTAFIEGLSTLRETEEVVRLVEGTVRDTLGAERANLWLREDRRFRPAGMQTSEALTADGELAAKLAQGGRPLLLTPEDESAGARELRRLQAAMAVPVLVDRNLLGILTLGPKRSGEPYNQENQELLATLARATGLALENARLHGERLQLLRLQLAQFTAIQEEERRRVARELHDGLGPALASLSIRLRTAQKLLDRDRGAVLKEMEEIAEQAQTSVKDIRRLIHDLRPAVLDELGLCPALREYAARFREEHELELNLILPGEAERLSPALETALFRIVQEALANAHKHAQARRVDIRLDRDAGKVSLEITDDGRGFDPAAPRSGRHIGLASIRERVSQLAGRFTIHSAPGRGTTLTVFVPLE
jgi:signal transduction histidine kinase